MSQPSLIKAKIKLKDFDPAYTGGLDKQETKDKTGKLCERIGELQHLLYANANKSLIILFQGMDSSGKDSTSKRILESVNPAGVETANFKQPSSEELAHDFLWRVHKAVPRYGNIGLFNRSHYEEVLVVRVLKLQPPAIWREHYAHINDFERILSENGVILLKFFLHISKEEQAERFNERLSNPAKNWKFSAEDLKMRAHWNDFQAAYEDVLNKCSTGCARWQLIPADHKWYRDYVVARTVVQALEDLKLKWPKPAEDLSKIKIV